MFAGAKGKQQKQVRQLQCQEQCIDYIPYYISRLSRAHFFPTTFIEIAVYQIRILQQVFVNGKLLFPGRAAMHICFDSVSSERLRFSKS